MKFLFWPILRELRDLRSDLDAMHRDLLAKLTHLIAQGKHLMAAVDDLKAILARVDTATTNIAEDIRVIKDKVSTGMSQADVDEVKGLAEAAATRLEGLDAENPDGTVPTP